MAIVNSVILLVIHFFTKRTAGQIVHCEPASLFGFVARPDATFLATRGFTCAMLYKFKILIGNLFLERKRRPACGTLHGLSFSQHKINSRDA